MLQTNKYCANNETLNARKILEKVMQKVEGTIIIHKDKQNRIREAIDRHELNGQIIKPYKGLNHKEKNDNNEDNKIQKKNKSKKNPTNELENYYDLIYLERKGKLKSSKTENNHPFLAKEDDFN